MAEKRTFRILAQEQGWCCAHGCLSLQALQAKAKGQETISPLFFVQRFGFEVTSGRAILNDWRKHGIYQCEHVKNCMLAAAGLKDEDIPSIGEEAQRFRAMRGKTFQVYRTTLVGIEGGVELRRTGEALRGAITSLSRYDWLWLTISLPEAHPDIKLGDQLYLDAFLWGTAIDISGPTITLLLPGHHHRLRTNRIFRTKSGDSTY